MKAKLLNLIILAATTVVFVAGCDVQVKPPASEVEVSSAPPPVQVDVATPSPGPDYVWIGAAWVWGPGGNWAWQAGRWDRPPHPGAVWVQHHYDNGRHVFVRGGWR